MCGITGIYCSNQRVKSEWIVKMTDALIHSGPDDEGYLAVDTSSNKFYPLSGCYCKVKSSRI